MDATALAIIGAMGATIAAMGVYIKVLHSKITLLYDAQINRLEKMVETLSAEEPHHGG